MCLPLGAAVEGKKLLTREANSSFKRRPSPQPHPQISDNAYSVFTAFPFRKAKIVHVYNFRLFESNRVKTKSFKGMEGIREKSGNLNWRMSGNYVLNNNLSMYRRYEFKMKRHTGTPRDGNCNFCFLSVAVSS